MPTIESKKKTTKKASAEKTVKPKKAVKHVEAEKEVVPKTEIREETPVSEELGGASAGQKSDRYFEAVERRKTAVARVRMFTKSGDFLVNNKLYSAYFPTVELQRIAEDALQKMKLFGRFRISAKISGGGSHGQAEALRHGLARCLIKFNPDFRKRLKRADFLKRDPRMKERKKFGLKKARRAPQWAKR